MSEEEQQGGLLDSAEMANEESAPEEQSISHLEEGDPRSVESLTVAEDQDETEFERPDWYPEKFWKEDDGPDLKNLAKAYTELQSKFSRGEHKTPEKYDTKIFEEANIPEDDELFNTYKDWAKENGVSQAAFNELAGKFIELAGNEAQQAEASYKEEYQKLGPNADATIKSMTEWAQGLVRKGVWSDSDFEEFKIMGGTAQGIRALQKVRSYYGDQAVPVNVGPIEGMPSKEELNAMVGKPEYVSDPAYRAKVEKMFSQVYGEQEYSPI